jgi:hypothetical protein
VFSVVSNDYRLVTNQEALEWAHECCRAVFPETKPSEWQVKATDGPASGGHCSIDLVHNSSSLDFSFVAAKRKPDTFGPFIRVTNSYNSRRALEFDIGFLRKVCSNGLILERSIIHFKFNHLRQDIGERMSFLVEHERLAAIKRRFGESFNSLHGCAIPRQSFEPLVCSALQVRIPEQLDIDSPKKAADWEAVAVYIDKLCEQYARELGENAYAVFNVITDFASRPPDNSCIRRERHGFQRLAGEWFDGFSRQCAKPDFKINEYLKKSALTNGSSESTANHPSRRPQLLDAASAG